MQLTIFAAGSRGAALRQPWAGLRRVGFTTTLAAPANFAAFVQEHGLAFHPHGPTVIGRSLCALVIAL